MPKPGHRTAPAKKRTLRKNDPPIIPLVYLAGRKMDPRVKAEILRLHDAGELQAGTTTTTTPTGHAYTVEVELPGDGCTEQHRVVFNLGGKASV